MLNTFIARDRFAYNIPSLDALLATKEIPDSFLLYDEQILKILQAAGIPAADAYACTKAIKKKKADKVASYKERFKEGFTRYLKETEGSDEAKAHKVVEQVWTIIENAANYMFCAAHAFSMACDSLYAAWLKVHYPYELYITLLKLYDEKKNKDKIAQIISEMRRYKEIRLIPGKFGQDNRDWAADKENHTISQSLSSIRYISKADARALYEVGQQKYDTFTDVLRAIQMNTPVDTRTIKILIELDYFSDFGQSGKLMNVYEEFFNGEKKLTKTVKSYEARLEACREFEKAQDDLPLPISQRLICEQDNIGLCLTSEPDMKQSLFFVREVDTKYGAKAKLYSIRTGKTGNVRIRKDDFAKHPFEPNQILRILDGRTSPRFTYKDGQRIPIPGETEYWVSKYVIVKTA